MELIRITEQFPDKEACIEHLEVICWVDKLHCPKCEGLDVVRKNECSLGRIGHCCCRQFGASIKPTS